MRKLKFIIPVALAVVLLVGITTGIIVRNHQNTIQNQTASAQANKLSDWQTKVKAWNIQAAKNEQALAAKNTASSLQSQSVTELPHTGPSGVMMVALVSTVGGIVFYQMYLRSKYAL